MCACAYHTHTMHGVCAHTCHTQAQIQTWWVRMHTCVTHKHGVHVCMCMCVTCYTQMHAQTHSTYLDSSDYFTCFRKTWSCGCEAGSIVTSNRGRKMLSRRFWNEVTIPISLYTLYKRGICKIVQNTVSISMYHFVFTVMLFSKRTVLRTSKTKITIFIGYCIINAQDTSGQNHVPTLHL